MSNEILFENRTEFRKWLEQKDPGSEGVWLIFSKSEKIQSITANEALEEALCFGWIDGLIKKIDADKYKKYFSPRRKGSKWSEKNKKIIEKLIDNGQVTKKGLSAVERSKEDGSWDLKNETYITDEKYKIFESKIKDNKKAFENYLKMPGSVKKQFAGLYFEPKKEVTRNKRLKELTELLERNIKPMDKYSKPFLK